MKKIVILLLVSLISFSFAFSQNENPDQRDLTPEERKALKKAKKAEEKRERQLALDKYFTIAQSKEWVIEAHTVYNKMGQSFPMQPSINFVSLNGEEAVIQLSFTGLVGWNGIGGITLEGQPIKYNVDKSKNSIQIQMTATGASMGPVDLFGTIDSNGNGRITASGNWGNRITFAGKFVPFEESIVYKGTTTY